MLVHAAVAALTPTVREGVRDRAGTQLEAMRARLPGWGAPWDVAALDEATFDDLVAAFAGAPCPALDPASGACLIHESRPSTCRLMGMSVVTVDGGVLENACPIQDAFPGYAELPPVAFDLEGMEEALEEQDAAAHAEGWVMTTIAGAVAAEIRDQRSVI